MSVASGNGSPDYMAGSLWMDVSGHVILASYREGQIEVLEVLEVEWKSNGSRVGASKWKRPPCKYNGEVYMNDKLPCSPAVTSIYARRSFHPLLYASMAFT